MSDWRSAWVAALDDLEADVTRIEELLRTDQFNRDTPATDPWAPPEGMGPLPLDLRPRADRILARQIAAAEGIARAMAGNRRQAALANRIELFDSGAAPPAYLDRAM
ncbi:hypothetical protein [Cryptosporangium aurantiacum]|uniref:Uncharacterized protein n=1 Tax=Cryptosporangium aurantiacum TaxID=134849 RepID=A0A1M7R6T5_9ACTN|nr:hypothetical protein [Cryptosporangium aurantiacum]SHN42004.1 hypothetical protein SAMN05443668_10847 [Cryptosporangium aurantiacum]